MGLLAPFMGILVDRWGPRKLIIGGSILVFLGYLILSRTTSLGMFYAAFTVIAIGMSTCTGTVLMTAVNNWFNRKAGMVTGIVASGFGLGGLIVPLITLLIDAVQWRTAMFIVGTGMLVIVFPLALIFRHKPEQYGMLPDGDTDTAQDATALGAPIIPEENNTSGRQAVKSRAFWQISFASACHSFAIGAVVTHMMPFLSSVGIARSVSGIIALILPVASIGGRLSSGWLSDRLGSRQVFTASFILITTGLFLFSYVSGERMWLLVPFIIAFSLGWGSSVTTRLTLLRKYFGRGSFGTILGFTSGIMMLGNMAGSPLAGLIYDTWGSYRGAWLSFGILTVAGAVLVFTLPSADEKTG